MYAPAVAARDSWAFGASADYSTGNTSEVIPYSVSGVSYNSSQIYSYGQPAISAWAAYDDWSVTASYKSGHGSVNANIQGAGTISKSFHAKEFDVDVRWLLRPLSSTHLMPYVLLGYSQKSNNGNTNELEFQDAYTQKDSILSVGAGAIIPLNETIGFQVEPASAQTSRNTPISTQRIPGLPYPSIQPTIPTRQSLPV
jgi:hypothetical protein